MPLDLWFAAPEPRPIVDHDAAERVLDAFRSIGNPDSLTLEEAVDLCAEEACACDEDESGACLHCEALIALGEEVEVSYPPD